jgi:DNA-binding CsgD family transcriptional regulator
MRAEWLEGVFLQAAQARSRSDLLSALIALADRHDCGSADLLAVIDRPGSDPVFESIHHIPEAYLSTYFGGDAKADPVMQHVRTSALPIIWSRSTYEAVGMRSKWEHMASCGLVSGASLATHLPNGRHLAISLERDSALPRSPRALTALLAEMNLFAACALDALFTMLAPADAESQAPRLTPRECEVLKWTMAGKTAWETGRILNISERTVVKHAVNASAKLGCVGKFQAAVKASTLKPI